MKQTKEKLWQDIIEAWKQSGMSQKDFCKTQKVAFSTFQYWKKQIRDAGETPKFIQLFTAGKSPCTTEKPQREISISFESGIRLTVPSSIPCEILSRIILSVNEAALCVSTGTI